MRAIPPRRHTVDLMFWLRRKQLVGSYCTLRHNGQPHGAQSMAWRRDGRDLAGQRLFSSQEFKNPQSL
jgi:hypothetical protein